MTEYFAGLMSGTSLDGVDAVISAFGPDGTHRVAGRASLPYDAALVADILALQPAGHDELARAARTGNRLARLYARATLEAVEAAGLVPRDIRAIGCHGQTIRHAPADGYTLQIGNLSLLAELTGIDTCGDFRSRDVSAGGQGAPLVPAFHHALFASPGTRRVIANIGGIANLTLLHPDRPVTGFDCGPGNMLLDAWIRRHQDRPYDHDGDWAASGTVHDALLDRLKQDPFFAAPPPKSTGRELFSLDWLDARLAAFPGLPPADVQATLLALSADTLADAVLQHAPGTTEVYLCGGGTRNRALCARIATRLQPARVATTDTLGLPAQDVEAAAFAWLARACLKREPGSLASVTGAAGDRILGALYPA